MGLFVLCLFERGLFERGSFERVLFESDLFESRSFVETLVAMLMSVREPVARRWPSRLKYSDRSLFVRKMTTDLHVVFSAGRGSGEDLLAG